MRVLPRGNWMDESGPIVLPACLNSSANSIRKGKAYRLDLANWLTDSQNGKGKLHARVLANRVWYLLFGKGLAPDLTDFGGQGTPPEHPELLDNLAHLTAGKEMESKSFYSGHSTKPDLPTIHLPKKDFSPCRLPVVCLQNLFVITLLAVSGLLVPEIGGPSVKPFQPPDTIVTSISPGVSTNRITGEPNGEGDFMFTGKDNSYIP